MIAAIIILAIVLIGSNVFWFIKTKKIVQEAREDKKRFDQVREDFHNQSRTLRKNVQYLQDCFFPWTFKSTWSDNSDINPEKAKMIYLLLQCVQLMYEGRIKVVSFYPGKKHLIRNMQLIKEIMKIANESGEVNFKYYNMSGDIRSEEFEQDNTVYSLNANTENEKAGQE